MQDKINLNGQLDEMQIQIRNKIGFQSFFLLYFLLLIDLLLQDYGVKWAATPVSILGIMVFSMGYFLLRIVGAGAYISVNPEKSKQAYLLVAGLAILTTVLAIIQKIFIFKESLSIDGGFGKIIAFFIIFFLIIVVASAISKRRSDSGND